MLATALAQLPALPLHTAGKYVAAAYIVVFVIVLIYVAIMATRLSRVEGELEELLARARDGSPPAGGASAEASTDISREPPRS